jgi:hypothetical protein
MTGQTRVISSAVIIQNLWAYNTTAVVFFLIHKGNGIKKVLEPISKMRLSAHGGVAPAGVGGISHLILFKSRSSTSRRKMLTYSVYARKHDFFAAPRLAMNPDPHICDRFKNGFKNKSATQLTGG